MRARWPNASGPMRRSSNSAPAPAARCGCCSTPSGRPRRSCRWTSLPSTSNSAAAGLRRRLPRPGGAAAGRRLHPRPGAAAAGWSPGRLLPRQFDRQLRARAGRGIAGGTLPPAARRRPADRVSTWSRTRRVLHAAYNDSQGVTARFNLNLLARANRELGADFAPDGFWHSAFYQPALQRIEMHLVSRRVQTVARARRVHRLRARRQRAHREFVQVHRGRLPAAGPPRRLGADAGMDGLGAALLRALAGLAARRAIDRTAARDQSPGARISRPAGPRRAPRAPTAVVQGRLPGSRAPRVRRAAAAASRRSRHRARR
jgi:hypothetical protein